jgi:cytochrome c oxidase assembly protein subunit 15
VIFLARTGLLLALILVMVSAYLRLDSSGIGCPDWPDCYARIGAETGVVPTGPQEVYQRLAADSMNPESWATPLHRLAASLLGLCTLGLALLALIRQRRRLIALTLLALTVYLAVIGIRSGGLQDPAIVMGNLSGGFLMIALLGWLVMTEPRRQTVRATAFNLRPWVTVALVLCAVQIFIGGLTSANFAATACASLPDCNGSYLPGTDLWQAMDLSAERVIDQAGFAIGGNERADIQRLHRLVSVVLLITVLLMAALAWRAHSDFRRVASTIAVLCVVEVAVGVSAILTTLPIVIAVAHNWLAALLLLSLLGLLSLTSGKRKQ